VTFLYQLQELANDKQHCVNTPAESVEEYFKLAVVVPFLDHQIGELSSRFDAHTKQAALPQHVLPCKITRRTMYGAIEPAVQYYSP